MTTFRATRRDLLIAALATGAVPMLPRLGAAAIATGPEDRRRALDAGFADFLRKPLEAGELLEAVVRVLR